MVDLTIIGQRSGKLTVIGYHGKRGSASMFKCICDCGTERNVAYTKLKRQKTKSCGCLKKNHFNDLTGTIHNGLEFIRYMYKSKYSTFMYEIKCLCGKLFITEGNDITSEKQKSCGCRTNCIQRVNADQITSLKRAVYRDYKHKALPRGHTFSLTETEFFDLLIKNCHYCNVEPMNSKKIATAPEHVLLYNGIDRLDNLIGYESGNVVSCCRLCNQAKHSMTVSCFKDWISRITYAKSKGFGVWN